MAKTFLYGRGLRLQICVAIACDMGKGVDEEYTNERLTDAAQPFSSWAMIRVSTRLWLAQKISLTLSVIPMMLSWALLLQATTLAASLDLS